MSRCCPCSADIPMSRSGPFLSSRRNSPPASCARSPFQRPSGLAEIPTWKEQGLNLVEGNWRGVVGPKNLGDAEVAYWSGKLAEAVKTGEWADNLKRNHWDADFVTGAE